MSTSNPGDLVVDVGANIGDTVLTAAIQVGPTGHVIGIEPHPRTFRFLQENLALNGIGNVEVINVAAGAAPGIARFSDDRRDDMNRIDGGSLQVAVKRLDDLVMAGRPVALLKVDVEGYEKFVLDGAPNLLSRTSCVHFEVSSLHFPRFGYTTRDLLTLLQGAGFRLFRLLPPTGFEPIGLGFDTEPFENLVALRDVDDFASRTGWSSTRTRREPCFGNRDCLSADRPDADDAQGAGGKRPAPAEILVHVDDNQTECAAALRQAHPRSA